MAIAVYIIIFIIVAVWELKPLVVEKRRSDIIGFCIMLALAAAVAIVMFIRVDSFHIRSYLW